MTDFQRNVCLLIKAALVQNKKVELYGEIDWKAFFLLARSHQIVPLVYYGIKKSGAEIPVQANAVWKSDVMKCIVADEKQRNAIAEVLQAFENNGIDHMPLKGTVIKDLYPTSEMRMMGDADILIREEQYDKIRPLLLGLGFEEGVKSPHEYIWKKKELILELHHRTFAMRNKSFVQFYGDGWKTATHVAEGSARYMMDDESNLVYLITHLAKHYRDCGIGIRHLVDIWVYVHAKTTLNESKIQQSLTSLGLWEFYGNLMQTLSVWFDDAQETEATKLITSRVFSSGAYGNETSSSVVDATEAISSKKQLRFARWFYLLKLAFPSYSAMKMRHPFLNKCPILLPVMWVVRGFEILLFKRKNFTHAKKKFDQMTPDVLSAEQAERHAVGLHFAFEDEI